MNVSTHPIWAVLTCAICVSPFWVMASSWDDGSEAIATAMGAGLACVLTIVLRHVGKVSIICDKCKAKVE